ncbi:MAG: hypothetical protein PHN64_03315 [Desulfovibrionaceae bacterium]|nr:hypothetical protein [Desulfovibrionaceae bacterium]
MIRVVEHGMTARALEISRLWAAMRGQYQTAQGFTDEEALVKAIAKKLGIPEKEAGLPMMVDDSVPVEVAGMVEALAGLE